MNMLFLSRISSLCCIDVDHHRAVLIEIACDPSVQIAAYRACSANKRDKNIPLLTGWRGKEAIDIQRV